MSGVLLRAPRYVKPCQRRERHKRLRGDQLEISTTQVPRWQPGESRSDRLVRPARICARAPPLPPAPTRRESLTRVPPSLGRCRHRPRVLPGLGIPSIDVHLVEGGTRPHYRQGGRDCRRRRLRLAHHVRPGKLELALPKQAGRTPSSTHHRTGLHYIASLLANPPPATGAERWAEYSP